jgi:hypothetical protein
MCVCGYLVSAFLAYSHTYLHTHTHSGHSIRGLRGVPALRVPHLQHPASPRQGIFCSVNACVYECRACVIVSDCGSIWYRILCNPWYLFYLHYHCATQHTHTHTHTHTTAHSKSVWAHDELWPAHQQPRCAHTCITYVYMRMPCIIHITTSTLIYTRIHTRSYILTYSRRRGAS